MQKFQIKTLQKTNPSLNGTVSKSIGIHSELADHEELDVIRAKNKLRDEQLLVMNDWVGL